VVVAVERATVQLKVEMVVIRKAQEVKMVRISQMVCFLVVVVVANQQVVSRLLQGYLVDCSMVQMKPHSIIVWLVEEEVVIMAVGLLNMLEVVVDRVIVLLQ
jgi:hypothetical protein